MKTKTFFLVTVIVVFILMCSTGIHAQTAKSNLDQSKLMQQWLGTWETILGKDSIEVWECQKYGKSFIGSVSRVLKGKKSPFYIANICIDSKEGNIKGFNLFTSGDCSTWIALWTTEKKLSLEAIKNFKPETVYEKYELFYETPTKMTATTFSTDGTKKGELKFNKVK